jgi:hypothetical protein
MLTVSLESLTKVNHGLCKVKSGASSGTSSRALPNYRLNHRVKFKWVVAATGYKTDNAKRRTD